jgi:hypothetical protein
VDPKAGAVDPKAPVVDPNAPDVAPKAGAEVVPKAGAVDPKAEVPPNAGAVEVVPNPEAMVDIPKPGVIVEAPNAGAEVPKPVVDVAAPKAGADVVVPKLPKAEFPPKLVGFETAPKAEPPKALEVGVAPNPPKAISQNEFNLKTQSKKSLKVFKFSNCLQIKFVFIFKGIPWSPALMHAGNFQIEFFGFSRLFPWQYKKN